METLDIIIVTIVVLLAVIYTVNKMKSALFSKKSEGCSGCGESQSCSTTHKAACDGNVDGQVFK
ncbi:MAG: FeoB-associated Cys-rich membrane protein [Gammaproteobacteria bacterium]|nr:FeoB-associated Cys-rich membrane protein [Gammaproteobacteria bacterium]